MSVGLQMALFGKIILLSNVSHTTLHISPCLKIFDLGNASYCLRNNEDILITSDGSWSFAVSFSIPVYFPFLTSHYFISLPADPLHFVLL